MIIGGFDVYFYKCSDDTNVISKTLSNRITCTGTLRQGTSVLDPVIEISDCNPPDYTQIFDPSEYNYMYIPKFGRYYFINNIAAEKTTVWIISAHVDVLMSYKSQILGLTATAARNETLYNTYLVDDKITSYSNENVQTIKFNYTFDYEAAPYFLYFAG